MRAKNFLIYVLPSMLAFAFTGVYAIVDGFFVGRTVGDAGLAAINIAYPLTALLQAAGTGIGLGGAVLVSHYIGSSDEKKQKDCLINVWFLLAVSAVVFTAAIYFASGPVLRLFGARGEVYGYALKYIRIIALFSVFQIFSTGLIPLVRNYNGSITAMAAMVAGFGVNVFLDWLFIFKFKAGVRGAAAATVIGQAVSVIPCVIFLALKKKLLIKGARLSLGCTGQILKVGLSPFGLTLSPNIVIIIINRIALKYGGQDAVAAYAVVSYVVCVVQLLLQGIGDGCQPLISRACGAGDTASVKFYTVAAYSAALFVSFLSVLTVFFLRNFFGGLFGVSGAVQPIVSRALTFFITGFVFAALVRVTTSYLYAVKKNLLSYLLIYGEPLLLLASVMLLPRLNGLDGVWLGLPAAQIILALAAAVIMILPLVKNKSTKEKAGA